MAPGHVSTHLVAELFPDLRGVSIADQGLRYATVLAARQAQWVGFPGVIAGHDERNVLSVCRQFRSAFFDPRVRKGIRSCRSFKNLVEVRKENWSYGKGEAQYVS